MAVALVTSGTAAAASGAGDPRFVLQAELSVVSPKVAVAAPSSCLALSKIQVARVKKIIVAAIQQNRADEAAAATSGGATGGVFGFATEYPYEIRLARGKATGIGYLNVTPVGSGRSSGWISGTENLGNVVLSDDQATELHQIFERAQRQTCRGDAG